MATYIFAFIRREKKREREKLIASLSRKLFLVFYFAKGAVISLFGGCNGTCCTDHMESEN